MHWYAMIYMPCTSIFVHMFVNMYMRTFVVHIFVYTYRLCTREAMLVMCLDLCFVIQIAISECDNDFWCAILELEVPVQECRRQHMCAGRDIYSRFASSAPRVLCLW